MKRVTIVLTDGEHSIDVTVDDYTPIEVLGSAERSQRREEGRAILVIRENVAALIIEPLADGQ